MYLQHKLLDQGTSQCKLGENAVNQQSSRVQTSTMSPRDDVELVVHLVEKVHNCWSAELQFKLLLIEVQDLTLRRPHATAAEDHEQLSYAI